MAKENTTAPAQAEQLLQILKTRFDAHRARHEGLHWPAIQNRLEATPAKLWALRAMETTGGEPDVIAYDETTDAYLFVDCAAESPAGRRSVCYDPEALATRKEHKPRGSAVGLAQEMGIMLLTADQYRMLQQRGRFDTKTSSWIETPPEVRRLGGALFGEWRYGTVFFYHNGVQSYYAARGFRGALRV